MPAAGNCTWPAVAERAGRGGCRLWRGGLGVVGAERAVRLAQHWDRTRRTHHHRIYVIGGLPGPVSTTRGVEKPQLNTPPGNPPPTTV